MIGVQIDREAQRVLWACLEYWKAIPIPPEERMICYKWVIDPYQKRFGTGFHQSVLNRLAQEGFLYKKHSANGGSKRYYGIVDPTGLEELLTE